MACCTSHLLLVGGCCSSAAWWLWRAAQLTFYWWEVVAVVPQAGYCVLHSSPGYHWGEVTAVVLQGGYGVLQMLQESPRGVRSAPGITELLIESLLRLGESSLCSLGAGNILCNVILT